MKVPLSKEIQEKFKEIFLPTVNAIFQKGTIDNPGDHKNYGDASNSIKNTHRNVVLKRGRPNFEIDSENVTGLEKVDLYCYYYFQMHFSSSCVFYFNEKQVLIDSIGGKHVYFIDIGCGPFTSGAAFNSWLKKFADLETTTIDYIGVDISENMTTKANDIAGKMKLVYSRVSFFTDKEAVIGLLKNDKNEKVIILNYSYLFASDTLKVQEFVDFTFEIVTCSNEVMIFQQNPPGATLNQKWIDYKRKLKKFKSKSSYPKTIDFNFEDVLQSCKRPNPNFTVYTDLIKYFE